MNVPALGIARRILGAVLALLVIVLASPRAPALTIHLTFDSGETDWPAFDTTGSNLINILNAAADYWEDIIEDPWTLDIEFYYDSLDDTTLAYSQVRGTHDGRVDESRIVFDTRTPDGSWRNWYYDPTPADHSEYDMHQTLLQEYTFDQMRDWYYSDPPGLLETNYFGVVSATAPPGVAGASDMFTVALHELGHSLGMTESAAEDEVGNYAYDFPGSMVHGEICGADTFSTENLYHLEADQVLMLPTTPVGTRRLPSATDILSIAAASDWSHIDLARKDLWAADDMSDSYQWEGNHLPDADDDASVRFGTGTAWMSGDLTAARLLIANHSYVDVNDHTLTVPEISLVHPGTGTKSGLIVDAGGQIVADTIDIRGGELRVMGGTVQAETIAASIESGQSPSITGSGTVIAESLDNDGEIRAFPNVVLRFESSETTPWNLDGTGAEPGILDAQNGDLEFVSGSMTDMFHGTLHVGRTTTAETRYFRFDEPWTLGQFATINLVGNNDGSSAKRAELRGGEITIQGRMHATNYTRIATPTHFTPTAEVTVHEDSELYLGNAKGDTIWYEGATFNGTGKLIQNGDARASRWVNIDTSTFDMDGTTGSDLRVYASGTLNVNSDSLNDAYSATLRIDSGGTLNMNLQVDTSWTADASSTIILSDNGRLTGVPLGLFGHLTTNGGGRVGTLAADVSFSPGATIDVTASDDVLDLVGDTIWNRPASVTGFGMLRQSGDAEVVGDTTIDVDYFDWDGYDIPSQTIVRPGITLTMNVERIESPETMSDGYDGEVIVEGGTLNVNTNGPWDLEGVMELNHVGSRSATLNGSSMIIDGGTLRVQGGESVVNAPVALRGGRVEVAALSTLETNAAATVEGTVVIPSGARWRSNGSTYFREAGNTQLDGVLELNSLVSYDGGTIAGTGLLQQDVLATVLTSTTVSVDRFDLDGQFGTTETRLLAPLTINTLSIDTSDNHFSGTINIEGEHTLTVNLPSSHTWNMAGELNVYASEYDTSVTLAGSPVNISGVVSISGLSQFDAQLIVQPTGVIEIDDVAAELTLAGSTATQTNRIVGGQILGSGTLTATTSGLTGYGSVETDLRFSGDSVFVAQGGELVFQGTLLDLGESIGTSGTLAVLNVVNPWNTNLANSVSLAGGVVRGGAVTNDGLIIGHGTVATSRLINNGVIAAKDGILVLAPISAFDLDGTGTENGELDAQGGSIHIQFPFATVGEFNGTARIDNGRELRFDSGGLGLAAGRNPGQLIMRGGTYVAPMLDVYGNVETSEYASTLHSNVSFRANSVSMINSDLHLAGTGLVEAGAKFVGSARIVNERSSELLLAQDAEIALAVQNDGLLSVVDGNGISHVAEYTQGDSGELRLSLDGTKAGVTYDQLRVAGRTSLDGELIVAVNSHGGSYRDPSVGQYDQFELLLVHGLSGTFDEFNYDGTVLTAAFASADFQRHYVGAGVFRNLIYESQGVSLLNYTALPGDANGDLLVDGRDFQIWNAYKFTAGTDWTTGDFDGDGKTTKNDFEIWNTFKFTSAVSAAAIVPEPASWILLACLVALLFPIRRFAFIG